MASQLKELWGQQSRGRKLLAALIVISVFGVVAATKIVDRSASWSSVADGASPDDTQELLTTLQARDLPVRLKDGKVEVRSERIEEARAIAAAAGLPRTGKGFELFDGSKLG